ncbi:MAG: hypothetical protein PQJ59_18540 [Spirochaetales bacterium]|nr:hypothetical protein [Spirochaetales bacterium]
MFLIKKNFPELVLILFVVVTLFAMFLINDIVTELGFIELKIRLHAYNKEISNTSYISLVNKFKNQMELYQNKINEEEIVLEEKILESSSGWDDVQINSDDSKYQLIIPAAAYSVNLIRTAMGRSELLERKKDVAGDYINMAYYFERNKIYSEAIHNYDQALKVLEEEDFREPIVKMHKVYCSSLSGDNEKAIEICEGIIREKRNSNVTDAASVLLQYLRSIEHNISEVWDSNADVLDKGIKFYQLMAYDEALESLAEAEPDNEDEFLEIQYYKSRTMEEMGKIDDSLILYQDIISTNYKSPYASDSNLRILSLAVSLDDGDLLELSKENNRLIQDLNYSSISDTLFKLDEQDEQPVIEDLIKTTSFSDEDLERIDQVYMEEIGESEANIDFFLQSSLEDEGTFRISSTGFIDHTSKKLEKAENELVISRLDLDLERSQLIQNEIIKQEIEKHNQNLINQNNKIQYELNDLTDRYSEIEALYSSQNSHPVVEAEDSPPVGTRVTETNRDDENVIITQHNYVYDDKGEKVLESYSVYYYDLDNRLYRINEYDDKNNIVNYYLVENDADLGRVIIRKIDRNDKTIVID